MHGYAVQKERPSTGNREDGETRQLTFMKVRPNTSPGLPKGIGRSAIQKLCVRLIASILTPNDSAPATHRSHMDQQENLTVSFFSHLISLYQVRTYGARK
jgi:hypothetical protein